MQDLMPLFLSEDKDSGELKPAGVIVKDDEEAYQASAIVEEKTEEIKTKIEGIIKGKEVGELTFAAYILLETLHKIGMVQIAEALLSDPSGLFYSALYCAVGMRAGMTLPTEVQFETTTSDGNLSIRDFTNEKSPESN